MSDFEHGNPLALELSEDTLAHLRDELARVLILKGKIERAPGVHPITEQDSEPRSFSYPLDPEFLKQLFFADDDDMTVKKGYVEYVTPHRLEKDDLPEEAVDHYVFMTIRSQLSSSSLTSDQRLEVDTSFRIGRLLQNGPMEGIKGVEYLQNDIFVSPNNLPRKNPDEVRTMTTDELREYVIDHTTLEQPMTLEDGEKLAKLAEYIQAHPRID